ncbi:MAG: beta-ketoacyl-ACP synthase II [Deltaproteobacteria bacterium]|nr:beta-ketoacyl-ACP synthase II [Deltaproteobacteria bacterium]
MDDQRNTRRRVAVTGVGLVTPLGIGVETNWEALSQGRSGVGPITRFDARDFPTRIAGEVRDFRPEDFIERKEIKKMDLFIQYSVAAADMALASSGLKINDDNAERVGVVIGVGLGGLPTIEEYHSLYLESGLRRISPFMIPKLISNLAPGQIAIKHGAKGVNFTPTSACSSGAHAVGEALRMIRHGYQDAVICGGAEACLSPTGVGGFVAMRALSSRNDEPERASRPFERNRDGFVMGEGAGVLVLEELESARRRGATILTEVIGYGTNGDAYHITQPSPEGIGAARCMALCLEDAGIGPDAVHYINAHGTSTEYNDANETKAIKRVFGEYAARLAVSSTKSMTGHLLGAAGGVEAAFTVLALRRGLIPPTINYEERDPECDLDYVPNVARRAPIEVALSNSYGFGGTNVALAFRRGDSLA